MCHWSSSGNWKLTAIASTERPDEGVNPDEGREAVMEADRAFAAAVAERSLDAWMEHMAPDAVRFRALGEPTVRAPTPAARLTDRSLSIQSCC